MAAASTVKWLCALMLFLYTAASHAATEPNTPKWMTRNYLTVAWTTALPVARSFRETDRISLAGANAAFQFRLNKHLSVGPSIQFQLLETKTEQIRNIVDESPITLVGWSERRLFLPSVVLHYYRFKRETMLPYIGAGLGALRIRKQLGLTIQHSANVQWHPAAQFDIGMILLHGRIPFLLNAQLCLATPTMKESYELFGLFSFGIAVPN
ncbi:MAG: hypothetical protein JXX29_15460 [Deltaproteobacteria bacterium]|nr:hypothetical protein [Deltaproteobacteria bacterium]MBN2673080.1 hypothetical protein [Deltaproteobacteria bacterium]